MKNCIRRKQGAYFIQYFSAKDFSFDCQTSALIIVKQDSFRAKLCFQNSILGTQVFDHFLLLAVKPTGKEHQHQLPRVQNKVYRRIGDRVKT